MCVCMSMVTFTWQGTVELKRLSTIKTAMFSSNRLSKGLLCHLDPELGWPTWTAGQTLLGPFLTPPAEWQNAKHTLGDHGLSAASSFPLSFSSADLLKWTGSGFAHVLAIL